MKFILKSFIVILFVSFISCDKNLEEVNIDPNTSPTALDAQILTGAIGYLGYIVDVDLNASSFLWAQYYTWGPGVSIGNAEKFVARPGDHDGYWQRAYANSLTDLKFLTKSESSAYRGVAKVLQAYIFQGLVDHFGDVPFSEAISGEAVEGAIFTPKYDEVIDVYSGLIIMLDEALVELAKPQSNNMGADDLIYGGDLSKWTKFANSLKLRILLRTSEVKNNSDQIKALVENADFISTNLDIPAISYNGGSGDQNPMFARFSSGVGNFYVASNTSVNILKELQDPRLEAFYNVVTFGQVEGQVIGADQGEIGFSTWWEPSRISYSSPQAYGETNPVLLMSDWEVWFLRAEAAARYDTNDDPDMAFNQAIANNFSYLDISGADAYANALNFDTAPTLDAKIDLIAVQKWISMNGIQEDEAWIETRRFDRPSSRLFTQGIFQTPDLSVLGEGVFPSTWLYPSTERSLNPKAPSQRVLTDRIFWDN